MALKLRRGTDSQRQLITPPDGELVYATCSILKVENEYQIKSFLGKFQDAKNVDIEIQWGEGKIGKQKLPEHNYDGFYYAKLLKN